MSLSPRQKEDLLVALVAAFTPATFDRMLSLRLGKQRIRIVEDTGFDTVVLKVIEAADREGWEPELISAAVEANSGNQELQDFLIKYPKYARVRTPDLPPSYAHILFISTPHEPTHGGRTTESAPLSQLYNLITAEALKQQASDPTLFVSELRDWGVFITTFDDASALLNLAINIAKTANGAGVGGQRMGLDSVVCSTRTLKSQPPKVPPEEVEIARRVMQLGSDGHILATREAVERTRATSDFESMFGAKFDALFHGPLECELRPFLNADIYNVYLKSPEGDGKQTVFGSESPPKREVPEGVIKEVRVPSTLRVMRKEEIKVVFCPEVHYAKVKFKFENAADSDIKISCEKPEAEDCTFEYDSEDLQKSREHRFSLTAINAAKNHNFILEMNCYDRQGEPIIRPQEWPVRLRRNYLLWLWDIIQQWLLTKVWRAPWYTKAASLSIVALVVFLYRINLPPPPPPPPPPYVDYWPDTFSKAELDELPTRWSFREGQVEPASGAILIKDAGMVLANFDKSKALYDFTVKFRVRFAEGGKAAWVFRARPPDGGYVFVLQQKGSELLLNGYKAPNLQVEFDNVVRKVPIKCCQPDDSFDITAVVKGGTIKHGIRVLNSSSRDGVNLQDPHLMPVFTDEENLYPYGGAGFFGMTGIKTEVENWYLNVRVGNANPAGSPSP